MNKNILGITLLLITQVHTAALNPQEEVASAQIPIPGASINTGSIQKVCGSYPHGDHYHTPLLPLSDPSSACSQLRTPLYPHVPTQVGFTPPGSFETVPAHEACAGAYPSAPPHTTDRDAKEREAFEQFQALHKASQRSHSPTESTTTNSAPPQYGIAQYSGLPFVSSAYALVNGLKVKVDELEKHLTGEVRKLATVKQEQQSYTDQSPQSKRRSSILGRLGKSETTRKMEALEKEQQRKDKELRDAALPIRRCMAVASICDSSLTSCMEKGTDALLEQAGMTSDA